MKSQLRTVALAGLNIALAFGILAGLRPAPSGATVVAENSSADLPQETKPHAQSPQTKPPAAPPPTPFAALYSRDSQRFAANLREAGCPEQTVKDILSAEVNRRYAAQENALRPKPADHVPWGWSANTSEGKLLARRQEAADIARRKQTELRSALGYDVPVKMPAYAMTASDQIFERFVSELPESKRAAALQTQDQYWNNVQALRERTRGFWQAEDIAELNRFKAERAQEIKQLSGTSP